MTKVAEICKFQSGGTPSKSNKNFYGGQIPWITTVSLNGGYIDEKNAIDWITDDAIKNSAAKIVPQNSILIGTRVGVGKTAINRVVISTNQDIIALIGIDESVWNKQFLCLFFQSQRDYLLSQARGATIQGIKIETISNLVIPSYSIEQQNEIVTTLCNLQSIIAHRKQQLSKLDELVKARFVEMFGDPHKNPMGWNVVKISEVIDGKVSNGFFAKRDEYCDDGNVEILGVVNIVNRMYSNINNLPRTNATNNDIEKYEVRYGDMLFCRSSLVAEGIGKASIVPENSPSNVLFECHVIRFPLDLSKCVPEYMQVLSTTDFFRSQVIAQSKTATMTTIGQDGILKTDIILPPIEKQRPFYDFIKQIDKSKVVVQKALDEAQLLFDSLMQEYFG